MSDIVYTREYIKNRLTSLGKNRWLRHDVETCVAIMFSMRTTIRKYMKSKPINDKLLVNNTIVISNILGNNLSYTILTKIMDEEELKLINTLYTFLSLKEDVHIDHKFHMLLISSCYEYKKSTS